MGKAMELFSLFFNEVEYTLKWENNALFIFILFENSFAILS